jgi:hypothetical protein
MMLSLHYACVLQATTKSFYLIIANKSNACSVNFELTLTDLNGIYFTVHLRYHGPSTVVLVFYLGTFIQHLQCNGIEIMMVNLKLLNLHSTNKSIYEVCSNSNRTASLSNSFFMCEERL